MDKYIKRNEFLTASALVVFVTFITYGVLIPQLGFYRDDWYMLLTGQERGSAGLIALFQIDRPFIGYLYAVYFRVLGTAPIGWHVSALIVKMAGAVSFLWLMRLLFPNSRHFALWLTLLYVVYPGFLEQPIAATYIHLLLAVTASILSLALTAYAIKVSDPRLRFSLTLAACALALLYLLIFESMIGLEAGRLCMIVFLLTQAKQVDWKATLRKTVAWGIPYLLVAGGFLVWRLFIFKASRHSTDLDALLAGYSISPLRTLVTIVVEAGKDFIEMVFLSWSVPFYQFTSGGDIFDLAASIGLAGIVLAGIYGYLRYFSQEEDTAPAPPSAGLWLGVLIACLALIPINLAGRNILFSAHWDRYTLHAAVGGVLILGSLIHLTLQGRVRKVFLFTLTAIGVITHFHNAAGFREFWAQERETWWQMSWRAPNLQNNTLLFVQPRYGYGFFEDYEIYGPANLVYTPDAKIRIAADLITPKSIPLLIEQEVSGNRNRGVYVRKNYKNALIFAFPTSKSCLHAIDGRQVELPGYDQNTILLISPFSKIERIEINASPMTPPEKIFGPPPEKDWCFYYQKISLARQQENWDEAARLAEESLQQGFKPHDPSEWIPVFEAFANTERYSSASDVAVLLLENKDTILLFCSQIEKRNDFPVSYDFDYIFSTLCIPNSP